MNNLALTIGGSPFPTTKAIQDIANRDVKDKFGTDILLFGLQVLITVAIVIALVTLIAGGVSWATSEGDKTKLQNARNTVIFAIVGLITTLLSFAIVNLIGYFFLGGINIFGQ